MSNKVKEAKTLAEFLIKAAVRFPDKQGLIFDDRAYSYREMYDAACTAAAQVTMKAKKGEVVGLLVHNSPEFVFGYFGILLAGCVVLLMPASISDDSVRYQVEKTNAKLIISEASYRPKFDRLAIDDLAIIDIAGIIKQKDFQFNQKRLPVATDTSTIIFTSGTTSAPKGVKLTHRNVVSATNNIMTFLGWKETDIDVNISPLSHSFGLGHLHCSVAAGGTAILFRDAVNLKKILNTVKEHKATTIGAVPAILRLICQHYQANLTECGQTLRFIQTNTSPLEPELIKTILKTMPKTDFNYYYGLSEASRSTFITFNRYPDKLGSVGQATPGVSLAILGPDDQMVPAGQIGEICIKGPHVIAEYWCNPQASRRIRDGFLHTGDMGYLDRDGFLFFRGRQDDIINISGEKVAPEEIEAVVKSLPGIKDVAAIGAPDRLLGEVVKVCLVVDKDYDQRNFLKACREQLEGYKVPRQVEIVSIIPRTENGKVQRNKLRSTYE